MNPSESNLIQAPMIDSGRGKTGYSGLFRTGKEWEVKNRESEKAGNSDESNLIQAVGTMIPHSRDRSAFAKAMRTGRQQSVFFDNLNTAIAAL